MSIRPSRWWSQMATSEPLAVGKYFSSTIPEKWTKSIPASPEISVNRNGLVSTCLESTTGDETTVMRSPSIVETILAWDLLGGDACLDAKSLAPGDPLATELPPAPVLPVETLDSQPASARKIDRLPRHAAARTLRGNKDRGVTTM